MKAGSIITQLYLQMIFLVTALLIFWSFSFLGHTFAIHDSILQFDNGPTRTISLLIMMLFVLLIFLRTKKIINEIDRIARETSRIQSALHYKISSEDNTFDEFQVILQVLESMAGKINDQEREIINYHDDVEMLLKERTNYQKKLNNKLLQAVKKRKKTEAALRDSEENFRTVFESIEEAYFEADLKGHFTKVNDTLVNLFGYTREELLNINYENYMMPDSAKAINKLFKIMYKTGKPIKKATVMMRKKDGTLRYHELSASLLRDKFSKKIGFRGIARDITENVYAVEETEKLKVQLAYAQKMQSIGTLAGGIAHNFNNLLMGIEGNTSILLLDMDTDHPSYKNLMNIEKLVSNGAKLTSQLLGYAREGRYEVKPINLNEIVQETSETFGYTRKEIRIGRNLSDKLWGIKVDQGQIEQVILNLCINAADAMPEGGELLLKTENVSLSNEEVKDKPYEIKPGKYVLFLVKDTGIGMDRETMKRIFEPFFTTKGMANGTGLGLASAYGIIKGHGGFIDVESEKGKGTTFSIYLPAFYLSMTSEKNISQELLEGKETILLVDDEELVIDAGGQMLEKMGYEVLMARNGEKALELLRKNGNRIDIVLLDMVMPDLGGGETYDRMKDINPNIKVILSSGYTIDGRASEILARGCNGFIQKPFRINELSKKIREVLDDKSFSSLPPFPLSS